jgi:hypothetical protein
MCNINKPLEKKEENPLDLGLRKQRILTFDIKSIILKEKADKLKLIKIKNFCSAKHPEYFLIFSS